MITELTMLYIIAGLICIMILLLISGLKGMSATLTQRNEIFAKQYEWMNDIYSMISKTEDELDKQPLIIGEEKPNVDHNAMFKEGIKEIEKFNQKKSKK